MPIYLGKRKIYKEEEKKEVLSKIGTGKSLQEVAKEAGIQRCTLREWRKEYGIFEKEQREKGERNKRILEESLKYDSAEKAGLFLGKGGEFIRGLQRNAGCFNTKVKRYSKEDRKALVEASKTYETVTEASHALNIPCTTLTKWRSALGVSRVRTEKDFFKAKYSEEQKRRFAEASVGYKNITYAAQQMCISVASLKKYCKKFGVPIKRTTKRYSIEEKRHAVDVAKKIEKISHAAMKCKISRGCIREWLKLDAEGKLK